MEGVAVDCFKNNNIFREVNPQYALNSYLSEDNEKDTHDTCSKMINIY